MLVVEQVTLAVAELALKAMDTDAAQTQTAEMGHVIAHDLPMVEAQALECRMIYGKRRIVVDAQQRDLVAGVSPAQHAFGVDPCQTVGPSQQCLHQQQPHHDHPRSFHHHLLLSSVRVYPLLLRAAEYYIL